jgi:hypothetical protein
MKRSVVCIPLLGFSLLWIAGPSAAGDHGKGWDYKILPGAACQPYSAVDATDLLRTPIGILNNGPRDERTVLCPIVRDTVNEYDLDIGVTVTTGVTCQFWVMNYRGVYAAGTPHNASNMAVLDTGKEIHYFSVKANPDVDPPGFVGYYNLSCRLPPGGGVFSYISGENADTTDYGE